MGLADTKRSELAPLLTQFQLKTKIRFNSSLAPKMKRFSTFGVFIILVFVALDTLLLSLYADQVPKRDKLASIVGFLVVLIAALTNSDQFTLVRSKQFEKLFQLLSKFEVLFTLVLPWVFLINEQLKGGSDTGYLLAPHLFVIQAQIAIEGIIMMFGESKGLMFQYTCLANAFRALSIATGLSRSREEQVSAGFMPTTILPFMTLFLWFCSNSFISFVWYPCLRQNIPLEERKKL